MATCIGTPQRYVLPQSIPAGQYEPPGGLDWMEATAYEDFYTHALRVITQTTAFPSHSQ